MAVFRYKAIKTEEEELVETGVVVAKDSKKAREKLRAKGFGAVHLEPIEGIRALWKRFSADVR